MIHVRKFVKEMIELQERKQKELERRGKRSNELLRKSDEAYSVEQWEAYHACIEHQQNKMMKLIHDLFVIRHILETVDLQQGD